MCIYIYDIYIYYIYMIYIYVWYIYIYIYIYLWLLYIYIPYLYRNSHVWCGYGCCVRAWTTRHHIASRSWVPFPRWVLENDPLKSQSSDVQCVRSHRLCINVYHLMYSKISVGEYLYRCWCLKNFRVAIIPSGYVKMLKHQKVKYPQFRQSKQGYWLIHTNPLS